MNIVNDMAVMSFLSFVCSRSLSLATLQVRRSVGTTSGECVVAFAAVHQLVRYSVELQS